MFARVTEKLVKCDRFVKVKSCLLIHSDLGDALSLDLSDGDIVVIEAHCLKQI